MTRTSSRDIAPIPEAELDALLRTARMDPPMPDAAFLDRIAADGLAAQAEPAVGQGAVPLHGRRKTLPRASGGWALAPLTALAASLVLGIGLGAGFAPELSSLSAGILSTQTGADLSAETMLWSFDTALEEGV